MISPLPLRGERPWTTACPGTCAPALGTRPGSKERSERRETSCTQTFEQSMDPLSWVPWETKHGGSVGLDGFATTDLELGTKAAESLGHELALCRCPSEKAIAQENRPYCRRAPSPRYTELHRMESVHRKSEERRSKPPRG